MEGWIKLHRQIMYSSLWDALNPEQFKVFCTILLMANHKKKSWYDGSAEVIIQPGQLVTSLGNLANRAGVGIQSVRSCLKHLEKMKITTRTPTNKFTIITICKWETYQTEKEQPNTHPNTRPTQGQHKANTRPTTTKECNNDKNVENESTREQNDSSSLIRPEDVARILSAGGWAGVDPIGINYAVCRAASELNLGPGQIIARAKAFAVYCKKADWNGQFKSSFAKWINDRSEGVALDWATKLEADFKNDTEQIKLPSPWSKTKN